MKQIQLFFLYCPWNITERIMCCMTDEFMSSLKFVKSHYSPLIISKSFNTLY